MNETSPTTDTKPQGAEARSSVWRRLLFGLACAATLLALFYAEENWRGRHAWEKHRREWEAKGEKFTIAALVPPPVPDDRNFALAPLLKPMLELTHGPAGTFWHDTNGWKRLDRFSEALSPKPGTNLVLGSIERATFADLAAWGEQYRGNTNYPPAGPQASPAEVVVTALGKLEPEFRELREAAASRPDSRYPVRYDEQPPWGTLLPHLARLKAMATVLQVKATAELAAGRSADAFNDLKLELRISDSLRGEPIIVSHLVRATTLGGGLQVLREGLIRHAWTDAQLAELQAALAPINLLAEYKAAMRGERAGSVEELQYLLHHRDWGVDVTFFFGQGITSCGRLLKLGPSGWIYQNMVGVSQACQAYTLPAVDEREHRIFPDISENGSRALQAMQGPYTVYVRITQSGLARVIQRSGRMQTFVDAAQAACALERYRLVNDRLPENLGALTPRFCERLPKDVIDGQPLRWRLKADGSYVLYSVGWNKTDDGGEPGWNQADDNGVFGLFREKSGAWVDPSKGDWVWAMPAK